MCSISASTVPNPPPPTLPFCLASQPLSPPDYPVDLKDRRHIIEFMTEFMAPNNPPWILPCGDTPDSGVAPRTCCITVSSCPRCISCVSSPRSFYSYAGGRMEPTVVGYMGPVPRSWMKPCNRPCPSINCGRVYPYEACTPPVILPPPPAHVVRRALASPIRTLPT